MDYIVQGILQARILEWVAFPFSRGSSQPRDWTQVSCIAGRFLYQLSHKGSPRILEWVAYPFSSRSSQHRNWTGVSCIAGGFFTNWAIREHNTIHPYFLYSLAMVFHWTVLLAWLQILLMETRKASHKFLITAIIIHSYEWLIITSSINHSCYFARYLKFFANLDGPVALLP